MGMLMPGAAWMFGSWAGRVKRIWAKAFELPVTCTLAAPGAFRRTVVDTPRGTVPKLMFCRLLNVIDPLRKRGRRGNQRILEGEAQVCGR